MIVGKPQWKIELRAATYPKEEWVTLRHESGREYKFVDKGDADAAMEKLNASQPHAKLRVSRM